MRWLKRYFTKRPTLGDLMLWLAIIMALAIWVRL